MQAEAVNAINDFGVFNPKSADYDEQYTPNKWNKLIGWLRGSK
jgi:hypothetical protein